MEFESYYDETSTEEELPLFTQAEEVPPMVREVAEPEEIVPTLFYPKISDKKPSPTEWIVKDLFMRGPCLTGVVGPSNCGKTFFVLDVLLAYITGEREWNGRKIYRDLEGDGERKVVYLCSEGADKILQRIYGYLQEHGHTITDIDGKFFLLDFKQYANSVDDIFLKSTKTLKTLRNAIRRQCGNRVGMIVIDTFNGFYGGKENDSDEVGLLLANVEAFLSTEFESNVVFIHHTGVDAIGKKIEEMRPRGATAFISKLDICNILNGNITYGTEGLVAKSREGDKGIRFYLLAKKVIVNSLPCDSEGNPTTTLVIQWNMSDSDIQKSIADHKETETDRPTPVVYDNFQTIQKAMAEGKLPYKHLEDKDYQDESGNHSVFEFEGKDLREFIKNEIVIPRHEDEEDFSMDNQKCRNIVSKEVSAEYKHTQTNKTTGLEEFCPRFMGRLVKFGLLVPDSDTKPTKWTTQDRLDYGNQFFWFPWGFKPKQEQEEIPQ